MYTAVYNMRICHPLVTSLRQQALNGRAKIVARVPSADRHCDCKERRGLPSVSMAVAHETPGTAVVGVSILSLSQASTRPQEEPLTPAVCTREHTQELPALHLLTFVRTLKKKNHE